MLDHLEIHSRRLTACVGFYRAVLEPLGYTLIVDGDQKGFGYDGRLDFWLVDGDASAPYGSSTVEPVVSPASSARWASATSSSAKVWPISGLIAPLASMAKTRSIPACRSSGVT